MDPLASLVLTALALLVLYLVVRKAVHHGILDAEESRREAAAQTQLRSALDTSDGPS
jgi:hypothetical protein